MRQRILVIDDDTSVRQSLERLLEVDGYQVVHSPGGTPGLASLKEDNFDLLLLDLDLPELKGWEILDFAVEHRPEIPVVLLTGLMNQCAAGAFTGTEAVLEKPTDPQALLQTLNRVLSEPKEHRLRRLRSGDLSPQVLSVPTPGIQAPDLPARRAGRSINKKDHTTAICASSLFQTGFPSR